MTRRRFPSVLAAVVATCVLSVSPALAADLTRAEFAKQANAICAKANTALEASIAKLGITADPTPAQLTQIAKLATASLTSTSSAIAKLKPPKADQAKVKKMLASLNAAIAKVKKDPSKITDDSILADANAQATALGLTVCAGS